jgi:hypothetical protein
MLSEEDKERIRREEQFRNEVRSAMAPRAAPRTAADKLWAAANSSFGLWFLSAVLVGGLGKLYADHQAQQAELARQEEVALAEKARKRETEFAEQQRVVELSERLALEVAHRFSATMARLHAVSIAHGDEKSRRTQLAIRDAFEPLARPASIKHPPLFAEFRDYSGPALISELRRHAGPIEKETLRLVLRDTSGLINEATQEGRFKDRSAREAAILLIEQATHRRWKNGFPYQDCTREEPFC